jgi:cytochrome c5
MKRFLIILISGFVTLYACKNKSEPVPVKKDPVPVAYCDSLKATYNTHVATLMTASCATSGCHDIFGAGGIKLRNYDEVKTQAGFDRFMKAIKHEAGFNAMPQGKPKLSDDNIKMLECWISKGFVEK